MTVIRAMPSNPEFELRISFVALIIGILVAMTVANAVASVFMSKLLIPSANPIIEPGPYLQKPSLGSDRDA